MTTIRYGGVSLDCDDPRALGAFWADLLGGEVAFESDDFVAVRVEGGWLTAIREEGYVPPTWPDGPSAKQLHLDLRCTDLDAGQAEAVAKGATVADAQPSPDRWRVLLDPAGHPFCITTLIPD